MFVVIFSLVSQGLSLLLLCIQFIFGLAFSCITLAVKRYNVCQASLGLAWLVDVQRRGYNEHTINPIIVRLVR